MISVCQSRVSAPGWHLPAIGGRSRRCEASNRGINVATTAVSLPCEPDIYLDPLVSSTAAQSAQPALLVLASPITLAPSLYKPLAVSIQELLSSRVCLAVILMQTSWMAAFTQGGQTNSWEAAEIEVAQDLERVCLEADRRGYLPPGLPSGRRERMFVGGHSAGGQIVMDLALKQAGGLVLLASRLTPSERAWAGLRGWVRPVLTLSGALDGQMRATRNAPWAVESAEAAARFGSHYAAVYKPHVLLEGVNHAQCADGVVNASRGDIASDVEDADATQSIAEVVATFLAAHLCGGSPEQSPEAESLRQHCLTAAGMLAPFTAALGRGDVAALWRAVLDAEAVSGEEGLPAPTDAQLLPGGVWPAAWGAELVDESAPGRKLVMHPGEAASAEATAAAVQRHALRGLPEEALQHIRVVATVCHDVTTFLYSQPAITALSGGRVRVGVRVYAWREHLESTEVARPPAAPQLWIKARSPEAVALALGLPAKAVPARFPPLHAADVHAELYDQALQAITADQRARFERCGRQLRFSRDRDVSRSAGAQGWVETEHISITSRAGGTDVCSPTFRSEARKCKSYAQGLGLFVGNTYIKCLSLAWLIEWVTIDGLRLPPQSESAYV